MHFAIYLEKLPTMNWETEKPKCNPASLDSSCPLNSISFFPAVLTDDIVRTVMEDNFGKTVSFICKLKGYDNLNFHIIATDKDEFEHLILKFGPCTEPVHVADFFREQISLMKKLSEDLPGLIQNIIPSVKSKYGSLVFPVETYCKRFPNGPKHSHNTVLLQYIPGVPMIEALPFSDLLLHDVGLKFGMLSQSLEKHASENLKSRTEHKWDPKNVLLAEPLLGIETKSERREVYSNFFKRYREEVLPYLQTQCQKAIIHSDGNCNNILVHPQNFDKVSAIIDFEDTCSSFLLFECASILMYIFSCMPESNFGQIGHALMRGFSQKRPLAHSDWTVLFDAVVARHIQSLLYGLEASIADPENAEYVLETQENGWISLKKLLSLDRALLEETWKKDLSVKISLEGS